MKSTSSLIASLVVNVKPVRRLRSPAVRTLCWLLFAALMLALVAVGHGVRPDLMQKLHQPVYAIGVAAALMTSVLATTAVFIGSIPGRSKRWLLLPMPAFAIWISTIGYGCLTAWVSFGPDGMSPGETARCFATLAITSIPLSLSLLIMLRYVARLYPVPIAMTASLAVAATTAVALSLFHQIDATLMILMLNFGVAALFLGLSRLYGQRLFEWVTPME
ncbi:DUF1109 domain-containing protein [Glaciimonas sp. CA11.2]|uniref:DUF1109 domain-containing protein n=1 Tax=unclassified Glaciimonas TaxID=2644401 RepID=UPI002AB4485B|nr:MULTISPECIES: DUF1109 domain-containing protein [unclassified Glaciimonas]MDY7544741.1 DUF1109 domain-containing protein [Glaciimonas sp. CA11.2]MEB0011961.1 DUF1109 domain-containing protein [Glaciimonas sp. Cout2]MEB0082804.1 DUF1109 domain-containing protein [Glaciimonas sp. Gout2]MEB0163266.1 DUF1109 domain-containing protein [Glaciimonas sp. CA11.2]